VVDKAYLSNMGWGYRRAVGSRIGDLRFNGRIHQQELRSTFWVDPHDRGYFIAVDEHRISEQRNFCCFATRYSQFHS
jgi:hypothetical protein